MSWYSLCGAFIGYTEAARFINLLQSMWNPAYQDITLFLFGCFLGAAYGYIPCDYWGRLKTLSMSSSLLTYLSAFRLLLFNYAVLGGINEMFVGIFMGISSVAVQLYLAEIVHPDSRGYILGSYYFGRFFGWLINITIAAPFEALILQGNSSLAWFTALLLMETGMFAWMHYFFGYQCTHDSPIWLLSHKTPLESFNALVFHRTADYNIRHEDLRVKREFSLLFHSLSKDAREEESWKGMLASTSTRIRLTIVTTLTIWKWATIVCACLTVGLVWETQRVSSWTYCCLLELTFIGLACCAWLLFIKLTDSREWLLRAPQGMYGSINSAPSQEEVKSVEEAYLEEANLNAQFSYQRSSVETRSTSIPDRTELYCSLFSYFRFEEDSIPCNLNCLRVAQDILSSWWRRGAAYLARSLKGGRRWMLLCIALAFIGSMILLLLFSSDRTAIHIGNGEAMLRMLVVSWLCVLTMCLSANVFCLAVECFPLSARSRGVSFFTTLDWLSATAAVCALMNGQSNQMFLHVRDWMLAYTLLTICVTILMVLYVPETAGILLEDSEILFEVIPEDSNRRVAPSSGGLSEGTGSKGISALATSSVNHGVVDCCVSPFATSRHAPRELWRIFCGFRRLDTLSYGISKHAVKASTVYAFRSSASDSSLAGMRPGNVLVTPMKDHRHTQWHVVVSEQQLGGSASFSRVAKPSAQSASASIGKWPAIIQHHQHATPPRQPPRKPETESIAMDQGLDWCNEDHESLIAEADEIIPQQLHKYSAAMAAAKWEYLDDDLWDTQKRDRPPSVSPLLTHSFPGAESLKQNISLLPTTTDVAEDTHTYWWQAMYDRVSTSVAMWMESIPRVWTRQERHQYHEIT